MTAQSEQSRRIRVGVLFGGRSAEHEISLISARNIIEGFDSQRYEVIPIGIDREGRWRLARDARRMLVDAGKSLPVFSDRTPEDLGLIPGEAEQLAFAHNASGDSPPALDVVFPVLHGPFGEDGSMQGLLKVLNLPFVGPGVAGSAVGMDKDLMKRLLRDAGIPIGRFRSVHAHRRAEIDYADVTAELGNPVYVKPANMGSSVGISRVSTAHEFKAALDMAFAYDNKIIIEESISGREIECAVLGNLGAMRASVPGEIIPRDGWYSYQAKYFDENGAALRMPADMKPELVTALQDLSVRTCEVLELEGMTRVDVFLTADEKILINEVNTIPGFTGISMYPKLWELSGLPLSELLHELVSLALERHRREGGLRIDADGPAST